MSVHIISNKMRTYYDPGNIFAIILCEMRAYNTTIAHHKERKASGLRSLIM